MIVAEANKILRLFRSLKVDESWTYESFRRKDLTRLTNSYHRYPARFIPELVNRLIKQHSKKEDLICDPFMGGGTALIEGLLLQRHTLGLDINPVAYLITKAKTTCIEPHKLKKAVSDFFQMLDANLKNNGMLQRIAQSPNYERIKFWFPEENMTELAHILSIIEEIGDEKIRNFLLCGFSHVLKKCSKWGMHSIKPYIEKGKQIPKPIPIFKRHIKHMLKKNAEFYQALPKKVRENINEYAKVHLGDCRNIPVQDEQIAFIVTSPPYVTSYEYADIHQLTILWLYPETQFPEFRKKFIGTSQPKDPPIRELYSQIANQIIDQLKQKDTKHGYATAVFNYFAEMQQALEEFHRVLKPKGKAAIIIGNTRLGGVNILNAETITETALKIGFKLSKVIKRRIPNGAKFLPTIRDPETGCFVSNNAEKKKIVYPHEYIVILSKP
ncbi:MAG: DNA methyltransferase [Candidatus Bathyarchaeia archaeon]